MQIQHKKPHKQKMLIFSVPIVVLLLIYGGVAYTYAWWPFPASSDGGESDKKTDSKNEESTESKSDSKPPGQAVDTPTENASPNQKTGYVDSPISNQPSMDDPYPISNEHYQIKQNNPSNYSITLYPIVNNPEYSDYNTQLKAYKNEALDYLRQRYGNINSFNVEWSPSDAASL